MQGPLKTVGLAHHRHFPRHHRRLDRLFHGRSDWASSRISGAAAFLVLGLVRWEDINSGVNWGVVLLYAAAISLGVEMKETGAAEWVASSVIMAMN